MLEIRLSEAARTDLIDIWTETYQKWGADQADRYLDDINRALTGLVADPQLGTDCSDLFQRARKLITGRHIAFYETSSNTIFVLRVLHQSMDLSRHLKQF